MDAEAIAAWVRVVDDLTYYALLGVPHDVTPDALKRAFHAFAEQFHPDAHVGRPDDERSAIAIVFKRANEAYRVLDDPALRERYDRLLAEGASQIDASRRSSFLPPARESGAPRALVDHVRSPTARPFARRAEELVKLGDLRQAKLQLTLARHHEPGNDMLEDYIRRIEEQLKPRA
jgi:curved DNA-binding protein CbpA